MKRSKLWTSSLEAWANLYKRTMSGRSWGGRCRLCRGLSPGALCDGCLDDLPWLPSNERTMHRRFGPENAIFAYEFPISSLIVSAKYHYSPGLCRLLGELLGTHLTPPQEAVDYLVPVPMPWRRILIRGYNHASELAQAVSAVWRIPVGVGLLARQGWQPPQRGASRPARQANLRNAFACNGKVEGRSVILVDDVSTTGATLHACAAALKRAGARRVEAVVLARTA